MLQNEKSSNHSKNKSILRSDFVQDMLFQQPSFIVRWGLFLFMLVFIMLIIACWLIKYPDMVQAKGKLTTISASKDIKAKFDGKIAEILVKENQLVKKEEVIAIMESTTDYKEVCELSSSLNAIDKKLRNSNVFDISSEFQTHFRNLGDLQSYYQVYREAYSQYAKCVSGGFYDKKLSILRIDLKNFKAYNENLIQNQKLENKDYLLQKETYEANKALLDKHVISLLEFRQEQSKFLNKEMSIPLAKNVILSNSFQKSEKEKEILEIENQIVLQKATFSQSLQTLRSQIDNWRMKYLLTSPIDGRLSYTTFLQENQIVSANNTIAFISPFRSKYYVEILIPQTNFGKVKNGQTVLIKFISYPSQEFGNISGKIDFISNMPTDSGYVSRVLLTNGLTTDYGKKISYHAGLHAYCDIITNDLRLLERFYYNTLKQLRLGL